MDGMDDVDQELAKRASKQKIVLRSFTDTKATAMLRLHTSLAGDVIGIIIAYMQCPEAPVLIYTHVWTPSLYHSSRIFASDEDAKRLASMDFDRIDQKFREWIILRRERVRNDPLAYGDRCCFCLCDDRMLKENDNQNLFSLLHKLWPAGDFDETSSFLCRHENPLKVIPTSVHVHRYGINSPIYNDECFDWPDSYLIHQILIRQILIRKRFQCFLITFSTQLKFN
jgi:hypothetical protein